MEALEKGERKDIEMGGRKVRFQEELETGNDGRKRLGEEGGEHRAKPRKRLRNVIKCVERYRQAPASYIDMFWSSSDDVDNLLF
jgi:uncharacterized ParB-like nuclease family protein